MGQAMIDVILEAASLIFSLIIAALFGVLLSLIFLLCAAFVLSSFWGWFIAPLGFPTVSFFHALGLALVGKLIFYTCAYRPIIGPETPQPSGTEITGAVMGAFLGFMLIYFLGFVVHVLMRPI